MPSNPANGGSFTFDDANALGRLPYLTGLRVSSGSGPGAGEECESSEGAGDAPLPLVAGDRTVILPSGYPLSASQAEHRSAQAARRPAPRHTLWRAWLLTYATLWAFTVGSGILIWSLPCGPSFARGALPLTLSAAHNPPPTLAAVALIAASNILHSVWPLSLGLIGAQRARIARLLADAAVLANLAIPGLLVGGAIGGYGPRALRFLPHVPLEWAGIAIGAAGWMVERERTFHERERVPSGLLRALAVGLTVGVLACAASVGCFLVPHRWAPGQRY